MAPTIENRDGVKIEVHSREHLPVHVHAVYAEHEALVNIRTGEMFEGYIPPKKLKIVQKWLEEDDNRERAELNFYELNPRLAPKPDEDANEDEEDENNNHKKGGKNGK